MYTFESVLDDMCEIAMVAETGVAGYLLATGDASVHNVTATHIVLSIVSVEHLLVTVYAVADVAEYPADGVHGGRLPDRHAIVLIAAARVQRC